MNTRRDFLRKGTFAGLGMLTMSELARAVVSKQKGNVSPKIKLEKDSVILFQGDSITDMFRKYDCNQCNTPEQMGMGYALFTASTLLSDYPDKQLKIYNRGVGGNKGISVTGSLGTGYLGYSAGCVEYLDWSK